MSRETLGSTGAFLPLREGYGGMSKWMPKWMPEGLYKQTLKQMHKWIPNLASTAMQHLRSSLGSQSVPRHRL